MNDIADLGMLCRALGFLAVAMKEDNVKAAGGAARAEKLAGLIEQFCRLSEVAVSKNSMPVGKSSTILSAWSCEHKQDRTLIHMGRGEDKADDAVIEIRGVDHGATRRAAERIAAAVNDNSRKDALIAEMAACLEMCLASDALDGDAEQDAEILLFRAKTQQP